MHLEQFYSRFKIEKREQKNLHLEQLYSNASRHGSMSAEKYAT